MRDDSHKWDVPATDPVIVTSEGLLFKRVWPKRLTLISGPHARQTDALPLIGWPDIVTSDRFALCLRRDRVLEVNGPERMPGWDDTAGLAISDMANGLALYDLDGARASALLKRGGVASVKHPSPSVARMMFDQSVLLFRRSGGFGLCVEASRATALETAIRGHVQHHGDGF